MDVDPPRRRTAAFDRHGVLTIVKGPGWVAVPIESGGHLTPEDATRLLAVSRAAGASRVYATALEPLAQPPAPAYPATAEGLTAFHQDWGHYAVALEPEGGGWVVAFTPDDYAVIAGRPAFVKGVVGDLDAAAGAFESFARDPDWSAQLRTVLLGVLRATREEYPRATPGQPVRLA
jgi:hypothetical protein